MPEFDLERVRAVYRVDLESSEPKLRAILADFYRRMQDDIMVGFFFTGRDVAAIAEKQGDFLLRAMGARPTYSGKSPAMAHLELPPIRRGMFDRRLRILEDTLRDHGVSPEGVKAWISFEELFRESIEA